jgi:hypothetical protein
VLPALTLVAAMGLAAHTRASRSSHAGGTRQSDWTKSISPGK